MACFGLLFAIFVKGYIFKLDKISSITVVFTVGKQYFPIKLKFTERIIKLNCSLENVQIWLYIPDFKLFLLSVFLKFFLLFSF